MRHRVAAGARFCDACGAPITAAPPAAEYKQVTVLFADVVRSMDMASTLDPERLREIMAELFDRSAAVVKRYGGTVDKFTSDGIMAIFGAPTTLEDHAFRACLAAVDMQAAAKGLADDVIQRDGLSLQLRIGLNSGQVIAGEIGSTAASYTTIGKQVGIGQRMESVAPPGGVLLSESTARLVETAAVLGDRAEYAFRHPLIRASYESQLKSDRAQLHRRLAAAIEAGEAADENAALIAEHFEAASDLHAAFEWHMRAGARSTIRNIAAAQTSWRRARQVADRLPEGDPDQLSMRIAPRTLLCGSAWRVGGVSADTGFDELRDLCTAAGDQRSLAVGTSGQLLVEHMRLHHSEASRLSTEVVRLLESIGDSTLTVAMLPMTLVTRLEGLEIADALRLAQLVVDLADGNAAKGNLIVGSPLATALAVRGTAKWCLGIQGWRDDLEDAVEMTRALDPQMRAGVLWWTYIVAIPSGVLLPDATALRETAETLEFAKQSGDDLALDLARSTRGVVLLHQDGPGRESGLDLLLKVRERAINQQFTLTTIPITDIHIAIEKGRSGDLDGAIDVLRFLLNDLSDSSVSIWTAPATGALVEALLERRASGDLDEASAAVERLAAVKVDPGFVLHQLYLLRLRALLAWARGDQSKYQGNRDQYREMAKSLGFDGHMAYAEAMP